MTALTVTPNSQPSVADELNTTLHNMMDVLGYESHQSLRSRFETFAAKLNNEKHSSLKSYTYISPKTYVLVDSYMMTHQTAMAFAMFVNPDKGYDFIVAMNNAKREPTPIPYFTEKSVNCRLLAERYNRSIDSVKRTFARNREWIKEIGGSEMHIEERGGELWFTEQYAACIAFGGGKKGVLVKAKAMVTYADNPMVTQDKLQPLLRLV